MSKVIEILVKSTFNTHVYKWAGKIYKQSRGGPIGLRASGTLAKAAMEDWIEKFQDKLEKIGIKVHMVRKYVDDIMIV